MDEAHRWACDDMAQTRDQVTMDHNGDIDDMISTTTTPQFTTIKDWMDEMGMATFGKETGT